MVSINEVSNSVDTVDLDLVVHGVEYSDLSADRQRAFLSLFADAVRAGLTTTDPGNLVKPVTDRIEVVVSDPGVKGPVNVRAKIPAPEATALVSAAVGAQNLLKQLETQLKNRHIQRDVKAALLTVEGLRVVTTWTQEAIHVSEPGEMDDFAGDEGIATDEQ